MLPSSFAELLSDRYRLERELGAGGMATVYLAEDVKHRRKVAVKVLHPELSAVLGGERFLKEIELTASLQHPHILPLFDSGEAAGQLFYVMPYVEGETLRGRLERERQLPIADALQIVREVADAPQYAHARGVIHRDIRPENILLQGGHALVADFGIALAVQHAGGGAHDAGGTLVRDAALHGPRAGDGGADDRRARRRICVRRFTRPEPRGKWKVTTTGGQRARWSPDGLTLYFINGENTAVQAVSVANAGDDFAMGPVRTVLTLKEIGLAWDVDRATGRIAVSEPVVSASVRLVVQQGWLADFVRKRREEGGR